MAAEPAARRLFFALWPPDAVRDALAAVVARPARRAPGTAVPPANYHITLAFLGQVPAAEQAALAAAARALRWSRFELSIDRSGYWSGSAWLGPSESPAGLHALDGALRGALETVGRTPEQRPLRPHVTVLRKARQALAVEFAPVRWAVDDFVLVHSVTEPRGAVYTVLEQFPAAD